MDSTDLISEPEAIRTNTYALEVTWFKELQTKGIFLKFNPPLTRPGNPVLV